jgi:hypothetical protein
MVLHASAFAVDEELHKTNGEGGGTSLIAIMQVLDVEWRADGG